MNVFGFFYVCVGMVAAVISWPFLFAMIHDRNLTDSTTESGASASLLAMCVGVLWPVAAVGAVIAWCGVKLLRWWESEQERTP